jgi:hypothetical protein
VKAVFNAFLSGLERLVRVSRNSPKFNNVSEGGSLEGAVETICHESIGRSFEDNKSIETFSEPQIDSLITEFSIP